MIVKFETGKTTKNKNICRLNTDCKLTSNHQEMADTFNKHFLSVAESINTKNNHNDSSINNMNNTTPIYYLLQYFKSPFPNTELKLLSTREDENIIKSLKLKNFHGYDEISTKLLKMSSLFIISLLTHIFNKSLSSGIFPGCLKYSEIKPLFKKGGKLNISNYRRISILTSFSKVLENAMYIQHCEHSSKNNTLAEEQFGFRTRSTTNNAIYKLTNEILEALNNKIMVGGIFVT